MKILLLCLVVMSGFFAQESIANETQDKMRPWTRLTVYPTNVDVWMDNYDNIDYTCSGNVYMYYSSGRQEVQYYYATVYARTNSFRSFRNYNYNDRIVSANHTIYCY